MHLQGTTIYMFPQLEDRRTNDGVWGSPVSPGLDRIDYADTPSNGSRAYDTNTCNPRKRGGVPSNSTGSGKGSVMFVNYSDKRLHVCVFPGSYKRSKKKRDKDNYDNNAEKLRRLVRYRAVCGDDPIAPVILPLAGIRSEEATSQEEVGKVLTPAFHTFPLWTRSSRRVHFIIATVDPTCVSVWGAGIFRGGQHLAIHQSLVGEGSRPLFQAVRSGVGAVGEEALVLSAVQKTLARKQ